MDDPLDLFLAQRRVLLASDEADLNLLKRHDRTLLAAMSRRSLNSPLAWEVGDSALINALQGGIDPAALLLEARARLWPGELARVQSLLLGAAPGCEIAWWLAAHYPDLPSGSRFPQAWRSQVWAAYALRLRGREEELPTLWRQWAQALAGERSAVSVAQTLWQHSGGIDWEFWLVPLLTVTDQDGAAKLINAMAAYAEDAEVIQMMGLSCQSRFLPWLASMRHDPALSGAALREIRWLTGDQKQRHPNRQCWGKPLNETVWPALFRSVPLGFRNRLWHWCGRSMQGAPASLHGGIWCAGS